MSTAATPPVATAAFVARLTQDFASSLDLPETLRLAIDGFMTHLDAEAASLFLLDAEGQALICRECAGPVDIRGLSLAAGQGIVGQTVADGRARVVRDVRTDASFTDVVDSDTGFATRSILCVPLSVGRHPLGALELLNKRGANGLFDDADLELASTVAAAAALAIRNAQLAHALVEQERVRRELELARRIQESLLPQPEEDGWPVHGVNLPAREVSGDFYDFLRLADGRVYFALADVSGKGMNAALLMAKTTSLLRCLAKTATDPGALLAQVNDELCETASMGMFVTIVAGYLDGDDVDFANAGHHPPLLRGADGRCVEYRDSGPPLGVLAGSVFPRSTLSLGAGTLYLYTDGLTESHADGASEPLGVNGFVHLVERCADAPAAARLGAIVDAWRAGGGRAHDDVTLLLVERDDVAE